jgi:dihydrofolate synthase / folylpolyglutamate synthase
MPVRSKRYTDALARLYALQSRGIRLGVSRTASALALRGHPERGQCYVQVGGTNGKGSVSAMIAECLSRAGYRTGLFTSPHLHRYVERVRIDGRALSEREATGRIEELLACFERPGAPETTFFELTTLLALETFRARACDIAVLEVGLGGRLDATTAVTPLVSVITGVALDHTQILGRTVTAIAREKAGIIKPGVPVVVGARDPAARAVIARRVRTTGTRALLVDRDFAVVEANRPGRFGVQVGAHLFSDLRLPLEGEHQRHNAACALAALVQLRAAGFDLPDRTLRRGLARTRWPARLERVPGRPSFVFDAAHNLQGCQALARYLTEGAGAAAPRRQPGRRVLIFGAMADKAYGKMLALLAPIMDRVFFCAPPLRRAASAAQMGKHVRGTPTRDVADALARARRAACPGGEVVVCGSLFLVAEARAQVLGLRSDPPIRM